MIFPFALPRPRASATDPNAPSSYAHERDLLLIRRTAARRVKRKRCLIGLGVGHLRRRLRLRAAKGRP